MFGHTSADGDGGFPGTMTATATFTVDCDPLRILYEARTASPTVVCMTNHGYWCLAGAHDRGHRLTSSATGCCRSMTAESPPVGSRRWRARRSICVHPPSWDLSWRRYPAGSTTASPCAGSLAW
ncbi:MAG: hypothetical protein R2714_06100 [Microthrixaceae bacterium]